MMGIRKETCDRIKALHSAGYSVARIAKIFGLNTRMIKVIVR